ncbi:MAG: hypothetical protein C4338_02055 [Rhodanobacteraceae bacterium]
MNAKTLIFSSLIGAAAFAAAPSTHAADAIAFTPGNPWAQAVGQITKGENYHEYTVHATAGKTLKVNLISRNPNLYFRVLPPDSDKPLIDTMNSGETSWSTQPAADTDYTVRVYADPSAIPSTEISKFDLQVAVL